jgi:uncharacterized membrane protein
MKTTYIIGLIFLQPLLITIVLVAFVLFTIASPFLIKKYLFPSKRKKEDYQPKKKIKFDSFDFDTLINQ